VEAAKNSAVKPGKPHKASAIAAASQGENRPRIRFSELKNLLDNTKTVLNRRAASFRLSRIAIAAKPDFAQKPSLLAARADLLPKIPTRLGFF